MMPFAKMKSALPEPSGFAAARLLDFSEFQSGAFAADAFGVGGVFQRFFRAAAILCRRASRSPALSVFFTPLPILPSACAALFIELGNKGINVGVPLELRRALRVVNLALGEAVTGSGRVVNLGGHDDRDVADGFVFVAGEFDRGVWCFHARTVKRFIESCNKKVMPEVRLFVSRSNALELRSKKSLGGGGGSETSCPKPREKSNAELRGGGGDAPASRGTLPPSSPASGCPLPTENSKK